MNSSNTASGYSNAVQSPEILTRARKSYVKALRLTNQALQNPADAKKDNTLFAVITLGMFETVTGCCEYSFLTWVKHIDGASILIKLRGLEQLNSEQGQHMLVQVIKDAICSKRNIPYVV
jgi:hypothetical protein